MDLLWKNIVYSVRMLLKRPSLTAVAIIAIALGIGANTAIFSVVNTVLLKPLPYEHPEQLVMLATEQRTQALDGRGSFSVPDFLDVQKSSTTIEYVAMHQGTGTVITEGGDPERILGAAVSADYFPLLRVKPVLGRVFTREEDQPGAPSVVVLSYSLWQRRFGGDPNIVGRVDRSRRKDDRPRRSSGRFSISDRQREARLLGAAFRRDFPHERSARGACEPVHVSHRPAETRRNSRTS